MVPHVNDETRRSMEVAHGDATVDSESPKSRVGSHSSLDDNDSRSVETEQQPDADGESELHPDGLVKEDTDDTFPLRALNSHLKRLRWILVLGLAVTSLLVFVSVTIVVAPTLLAQSRGADPDDDGEYKMEILKMHEANADIPTFNIEPFSERHERHLQGLSCSDVGGSKTCSFQGVMKFTDAMKLYRTFCPHWPGSRVCARSGLPTVKLTCNGHESTVFGGHRIPAEPPVLNKDPQNKAYALFPAADRGYFAIQDVAQGDGSSCSHVFEGGMYCYVEQPQTCFVWAASDPGVDCGGYVSLCGA
jgi:hypothetical protein